MYRDLLVTFLCIAPAAAALGGITLYQRLKGEHLRKKPFAKGDRGLRWAGYTLQKELAALDEKLNLLLVQLLLLPPLVLALYLPRIERQPLLSPGMLVWFIPFLAICGWLVHRLMQAMKSIRRKRLGMIGEQMTGQMLNELVREGCHVLHDLPQDGWNIDHVIVSPTGVYAVETKLRRKTKQQGDAWSYRVEYDGKSLRYEGNEHAETRAVAQARRNARDLSVHLEKKLGQPVPVTPVLALPGWYVNRSGSSDVLVVSPKEFRRVVRGRNVLPDELVKRIAGTLEEACRDVEW